MEPLRCRGVTSPVTNCSSPDAPSHGRAGERFLAGGQHSLSDVRAQAPESAGRRRARLVEGPDQVGARAGERAVAAPKRRPAPIDKAAAKASTVPSTPTWSSPGTRRGTIAGAASASVKTRPSCGVARSSGKSEGLTAAAGRLAGPSAPSRTTGICGTLCRPAGIRIGQRPQEETVYETEGRGVRADADGENDQRGEGERGPRGELPQRLAHIEAKPSHVQHRTKRPARKPPPILRRSG